MKLYRYYIRRRCHYDYIARSSCKLVLEEINVIKETKHGYWIEPLFDSKRKRPFDKIWVSKTARKRYAHLDKKDALVSFMKRKEKQISIVTNMLNSAEQGLMMAQQLRDQPLLEGKL